MYFPLCLIYYVISVWYLYDLCSGLLLSMTSFQYFSFLWPLFHMYVFLLSATFVRSSCPVMNKKLSLLCKHIFVEKQKSDWPRNIGKFVLCYFALRQHFGLICPYMISIFLPRIIFSPEIDLIVHVVSYKILILVRLFHGWKSGGEGYLYNYNMTKFVEIWAR